MKTYEFPFRSLTKYPGYIYKERNGVKTVEEGDLTFDQCKELAVRLEKEVKSYPEIVQLIFINKIKRG